MPRDFGVLAHRCFRSRPGCSATSSRDRRPGLPIEPIWNFYPKYGVESVVKLGKWIRLYSRLRAIYFLVKKDQKKLQYMDLAWFRSTTTKIWRCSIRYRRPRFSSRSIDGSMRMACGSSVGTKPGTSHASPAKRLQKTVCLDLA
jgi:hypothetical protein